ncbi:uncharacterized protein Z518_01018 [Rhinocladiella mackenziei CBS 650.93]|uniref:glycogenin glucosyltransferase n=1 Tax=Rhinocladiella mackenziei CBS 650.93 TaxID=1442369 RepID=A0A0D2G588_9EURO|nr:uncharacterized protein Z518_01018 [Rhinocladiella mackenziei CBS 650.93]KIX09937.1 hypothetical protein Z518_01018 [Rhinocladiella mackenziei CBS 650.93]
MAPIGAAVFATLLMNDAYLPGAMVLGHSLKETGAKAPLIAFVLVDKLSSDTIAELRTVYDDVVPVQQIINKNPTNLYLMNRPDLVSTFTKIELWRQTQFKRIVYLDADMVVLRAPNELLTLNTNFAAVPDIGWPDCFNTGLLVLNPNMADYHSLYALAQRGISFDGADQGLLNMHFREWERLSFVYNCTPSGNYQYVPAYRHFSSSIAVVHFIGPDKPWTLGRENKYNTGVYGELLGMWWSVYDRHYRPKPITYYDTRTYQSTKRVQDYVRGEEPLYVASYPSQESATAPTPVPPPRQEPSPPQQGQIPPPPSEMTMSDLEQNKPTTVELPLGDVPTPTAQGDSHPVPTVEPGQFSAPHIEWEPARAPPPVHSKPEAANFPTQIYDMSSDTKLFQPPAHYPEAPKDMWYQVPEKVPEPVKPKPIFPWESRAPKPTRVFAAPKASSPPPPPPPEPAKPRHIFPWESRAPKPTRVFAEPKARSPPPPLEPTSVVPAEEVTTPSTATDATEATDESVPTPGAPPIDPWAAFQQRTNVWDDMPEIERYVQAISQSRKGKLQVLHHAPSQRASGSASITSPPAEHIRRPSMKLTDFPSEVDRPSLPVTPAPIRRPTFWGEERDEEGNLPAAEGVPKQEDWVRRSSSYPKLALPDLPPLLPDSHGVLYWRCQFCGRQNPVAKLEELQRRQSEVLMGPTGTRQLSEAINLPKREMPESGSKEAAIEAANLSISPIKSPKAPKPILKAPGFELEPEKVDPLAEKSTDTKEDDDATGPSIDPLAKIGGESSSELKSPPVTTNA